MEALIFDSDCEIWYDVAEKNGIDYISMPYTIDGKESFYDLGKATDFKDFYNRVRNGSMPTTSALNPQMYKDFIEPYFKRGEDILYVAFGRTYSATFESLDVALKDLAKEYPDRKLTIFDTKAISVPSGIQVEYAIKLKKQGKTNAEILEALKEFTNHVACYFCVDNLMHLHRGGRLSWLSGVAGTLLGIKPIITFDEQGKLFVCNKIRGKKHSLKFMADAVIQNAKKLDEFPVYVLDADDDKNAEDLIALVKAELPDANIKRIPIGPVIGTHCGPGTLAVVYYADQRVIPLKQ